MIKRKDIKGRHCRPCRSSRRQRRLKRGMEREATVEGMSSSGQWRRVAECVNAAVALQECQTRAARNGFGTPSTSATVAARIAHPPQRRRTWRPTVRSGPLVPSGREDAQPTQLGRLAPRPEAKQRLKGVR